MQKLENAITANLTLQKLYNALELVNRRLQHLEASVDSMSEQERKQQLALVEHELKLNAKIRRETAELMGDK